MVLPETHLLLGAAGHVKSAPDILNSFFFLFGPFKQKVVFKSDKPNRFLFDLFLYFFFFILLLCFF